MSNDMCQPQNNMDCYYNNSWKKKYIEKDLGKNIISYFSNSQNEINENIKNLIKNNSYINNFKLTYKNRSDHIAYVSDKIKSIIKNPTDKNHFNSILISFAKTRINVMGEIYIKAHHTYPRTYVINLDEIALTLGNVENYKNNTTYMINYISGLHDLYDTLATFGYNLNSKEKFVQNVVVAELMFAEYTMSFIDSTDPMKTSNSITKKDFIKKYQCKYYTDLFAEISDNSYINISNIAHIEFVVKLMNNFKSFSNILIDYTVYKYFITMLPYLNHDDILIKMIPHYESKDRTFQIITEYVGPFIEAEYEKTVNMDIRRDQILDIFETIRTYCIKKFSSNKFFSQKTNLEAINKLKNMSIIIGKSHNIFNLSEFPVLSDNFFYNIDNIDYYYYSTMIKYVGKQIDRSIININNDVYSFYLNAYYEQTLNTIYLPTSICTNYFFNPDLDPIYNYGSIGTIIGHEIMHSFDNNGALYDSNGILKNWWSELDYNKFNEEVNKIKTHYSKISIENIPIDGSLSVSENFADIIGIKISLRSYIDKYMSNIINYDTLKIFFSQWVNSFKTVTKKEYFEHLVKNDVHAPGIVRVNAPFAHILEYYDTYAVKSHHKNYLDMSDRTVFLE